MAISLLHTALEILIIGILFRLYEYQFPETSLGKLLIFAY